MVDWGRLIALIVPVFNVSLYPCPFIVPSHTAFGPDHVTCFDQMNSYKLDASRGLKRHSCGSDFSRPGMGRVQACAFWKNSLGDSDMHSSLKISGLPWWRSGWESACQCRGHGFEPWSGKIPHAAEQLGPWATTAEPARLEPVLHSKRGRNNERPAHRDEEWPPLAATRGSPHTETKTQHSQKINNN